MDFKLLLQEFKVSEDLDVDKLSRLVSRELGIRLINSSTSMLTSGIIPGSFKDTKDRGNNHYILAIDFGGTTCKSAIISRHEFKIVDVHTFDVPFRVLDTFFFDTIIQSVCGWVYEYTGDRLFHFQVGITFSFPLNSRNEITTMGKGFTMTEEVCNISVQTLIQRSFCHVLARNKKYGFKVSLCGVINDSVAVFLTNKVIYGNNDTVMILGTGLNFCFTLPYEMIPKSKLPVNYRKGDWVLINSEAGFLGSGYLPLGRFDQHHTEKSAPYMPLEYLASGKWIPKSLENALCSSGKLPSKNIVFNGELICDILDAINRDLFGADFEMIQEITRLLIDRAAIYIYAVIKGIYRFRDGHDIEKPIVIGFTGSFLHYCKYYYKKLLEVSGGMVRYNFLPDSNLLGAAIHTVYYPQEYQT
ncbi:hexokinase Ecym_1144 [Eremothecium cymbalariae DBVPG|uniref:Phosphotransferase n=1 Tax=Eremothecium cymbalariae (strain CBS 270.75 / DBVPG 7215 / KCTC 17166 / NRRL Y-17582) TaxID=931890 RepID=G8JMP1_ERECY|nr:hypothetical protein Ecym_1144 [Eremothecium cymbalariae DBVPG\